MNEFWRFFLIIGGGIIFTISVMDSGIRFFRHLNRGKKNVGKHFNNRVKKIIDEDRVHNCPWLLNTERENLNRSRELNMLKETIIAELQPIKKDISEIKELNVKLHHAQMTDLQIKLSSLFHDKFDIKGSLSKADQTNWDKWFSDYSSLGGNSDIKKMDDLIQKAREHITINKLRKGKKEENEKEVENNDN